jgi:hypothetical protein
MLTVPNDEANIEMHFAMVPKSVHRPPPIVTINLIDFTF